MRVCVRNSSPAAEDYSFPGLSLPRAHFLEAAVYITARNQNTAENNR